jgi:uncharacterized protein
MTGLRLAAIVFGCWLVIDCSSSPPVRFYTLKVIAPSTAPTATISQLPNQVVVRLEPVAMPPELDRPELVSRSGPYRLHIAESDRWAAPLEEQIRRVLSDDLAARLPPQLMADPNEPAGNEPRRLLSVSFAELSADETCATTLRADWTLRNGNGNGNGNVLRGSQHLQTAGSGCAGELPAAISAALASLADQLAVIIVGQPNDGAAGSGH